MTDPLFLAQEARIDRLIDREIDRRLDLLLSNADRVGPSARHKLRGILRHYAKMKHPFTACVKDNTKRFGPGGAERVCAVLKDILRGTTRWRGHPALDHGSPGAVAASEAACPLDLFDDDVVELLMSVDIEKLEELLSND